MKSPFRALISVALLAACSDSGGAIPTGDPQTARKPDLRGFLYHADVAIAEGGKFAWAQQALSGYREVTAADCTTLAGSWWLAVSCWLSAVSCWWLVVGC